MARSALHKFSRSTARSVPQIASFGTTPQILLFRNNAINTFLLHASIISGQNNMSRTPIPESQDEGGPVHYADFVSSNARYAPANNPYWRDLQAGY